MGYHTHRPPTRSLVQRSQPGPIPYGVDGAVGYHTHRPPTRSLVQRSQPGPIPYGVDGAVGYHTHRPPTRSLVQRSQPGPIPYGVDGGRGVSYTQTTYPESCPTISAWSYPLWSRRGPWGIIHTDHLPGILSNDLSLVLFLME